MTGAQSITQANDARCIDSCIPDGMKSSVLIYLLALAAGVDSVDPNTLMRSARRIDCYVPDGCKLSIIIYLLSLLKTQHAILGEQGEFLGGEGGGFIMEE